MFNKHREPRITLKKTRAKVTPVLGGASHGSKLAFVDPRSTLNEDSPQGFSGSDSASVLEVAKVPQVRESDVE